MLVFGLLILWIAIYYIYFRRRNKAFYMLPVPTVGSHPIFGHLRLFFGGPEKILNNIKKFVELVEESGGITKLWIGPSPYIVSLNPDDVKLILDNCLEKDNSYKFIRDWLGNGLFVAPVALWKFHRRILVSIFHHRIIEDYIEIFGAQGAILVKRLEKQIDGPEFDVFNYITSCTMDIVFETAMGKKMDVQHNPDTPYVRARSRVMSIINMRLFKAWLQPDAIFNLTPYSKIQKDHIELTHKFTDDVIKMKKDQTASDKYWNNMKEGPKDILEMLLTKDVEFTDKNLREHIDSITIAGNDTMALVISYVLVLMGCHQTEQEKVYTELNAIFGNSMRQPNKEDLAKMDYLERVIKETMRLYSVVPIIGRQTDRELKLSTCTIPASIGCAVLPFAMHRSKKLWGPDVDHFNPDRFLPENSASRHPCSYIPFSYGARNCIGRHYGMIAMKSILSNVLRSFKVKSKECKQLKIEILLFPVAGHLITLERRDIKEDR